MFFFFFFLVFWLGGGGGWLVGGAGVGRVGEESTFMFKYNETIEGFVVVPKAIIIEQLFLKLVQARILSWIKA